MKILFSILFFFNLNSIFGQTKVQDTINSQNYYEHYFKDNSSLEGKDLATHWLSREEVVPLISEELVSEGFDWIYQYSLYKLPTRQNIVLSVYCRKSNFGFLYIEGHSPFPLKKDRLKNRYKTDLGIDYSQCEETFLGKPNFFSIEKIPENIFVISENSYWYQDTENKKDDNILVTKQIAMNILRQDIRNCLKNSLRIKR